MKKVALQLIRFAVVGGLCNVVYFVLFLSLRGDGAQVANMVATIASTALANEMHRRLTFRAAGHVGWFAAQWAGGAMAFVGLAFSSTAIALLHFAFPAVGDVTTGLVVIGVGAAVGGMRFLALRGWVFAVHTAPTEVVSLSGVQELRRAFPKADSRVLV